MIDTRSREDVPLACTRCGAAADARVSDVMVCEGCLGRQHAACWSGRCDCGSSSAFGPIGKNDVVSEFGPTVLPGRRTAPVRRRSKARVAGGFALVGLAAAAILAPRHRAPEQVSVNEPTESVVKAIQEGLRESALDAGSLLVRATERAHRGDFQGAIADATRAIQLEPNNAYAFTTRAWVRPFVGDVQGSLADEERAIELAPMDAVGWNGRGYIRGLMGDYPGAIADATKAIELSPGYAFPWNNRGYARMWSGDLEGAASDFERSLALDPQNSYAWENRGHLRLRRGDREGARADWKKALEVDAYKERTDAVTAALGELDPERR